MTVNTNNPPPMGDPACKAAVTRKRRRRTPTTGAAEDCHTCRSQGRICDRRRPYCSQCLEVGSECSGYRTQLTWGMGVASRGKLRGMAVPLLDEAAKENQQKKKDAAGSTPSKAKKPAPKPAAKPAPKQAGRSPRRTPTSEAQNVVYDFVNTSNPSSAVTTSSGTQLPSSHIQAVQERTRFQAERSMSPASYPGESHISFSPHSHHAHPSLQLHTSHLQEYNIHSNVPYHLPQLSTQGLSPESTSSIASMYSPVPDHFPIYMPGSGGVSYAPSTPTEAYAPPPTPYETFMGSGMGTLAIPTSHGPIPRSSPAGYHHSHMGSMSSDLSSHEAGMDLELGPIDEKSLALHPLITGGYSTAGGLSTPVRLSDAKDLASLFYDDEAVTDDLLGISPLVMSQAWHSPVGSHLVHTPSASPPMGFLSSPSTPSSAVHHSHFSNTRSNAANYALWRSGGGLVYVPVTSTGGF